MVANESEALVCAVGPWVVAAVTESVYSSTEVQAVSRDVSGATEIARTDIARPPKLWRLTSRDWTTRDHIARVDIARPDNVAPDQTEVYNFFMLHGISGLNELHLSVCTSLLRHLCVLLYTVLVFFRRQQRQTHQTLNDVLDVLITSVYASFRPILLVHLIITCA